MISGAATGGDGVPENGAGIPPPEAWAEHVGRLFARVAPRYDLVNNIMTGWQHPRWRRRALEAAGPLAPASAALDLCCGTGDFLLLLAERLGPEGRLLGVDFCRPMLDVAAARLEAAGAAGRARLLEGDVTRLADLPADAFDLATVGFGLRNVADLGAALREARRVLRPGGVLISLDMSWPRRGVLGALGLGYVRWGLPLLAWACGGPPEDYRWLRRSLESFPDAAALARRMGVAGFIEVTILRFGFGLVAAHVARKPAGR